VYRCITCFSNAVVTIKNQHWQKPKTTQFESQFIQQWVLFYSTRIIHSHTGGWEVGQAPHNAHCRGIVADNHPEINAGGRCHIDAVACLCSKRRALGHPIHSKCRFLRRVSCKSLALFYAAKVPEILFIKPATAAYWRYCLHYISVGHSETDCVARYI